MLIDPLRSFETQAVESGESVRIHRIVKAFWFAGCLSSFAAVAFAQDSIPSAAASLESLTSELNEALNMLGGTGFATSAVPRLGIPSFNMSDGPSGIRSPGPSTAYAAGIGLAATWDPELAQEVGRQLGRDARARGSHYLLANAVAQFHGAFPLVFVV